jgi:hypothetical protein
LAFDKYSTPNILKNNQVNEDEVGRACSTHESGENIWLLVKPLKEKAHNEDLDIDGRMILKYIIQKWDEYVDWIYLAQGPVADCCKNCN